MQCAASRPSPWLTELRRPWPSQEARRSQSTECEKVKREWDVLSLFGWTYSQVFHYTVQGVKKGSLQKGTEWRYSREKQRQAVELHKCCLGFCKCPVWGGCPSRPGCHQFGSLAPWVGHPSTPQRTELSNEKGTVPLLRASFTTSSIIFVAGTTLPQQLWNKKKI